MYRNLYQSVYGRVSVVILRQAGDETRCRYAHVKKCRAPTRHPTVHRHVAFRWFEPFRHPLHKKERPAFWLVFLFYGAGDEARTRYLHLGKVALYRMSYTRNGHDLL